MYQPLFKPLIGLRDDEMDIDTMIFTDNGVETDTTGAILGKEHLREKHGEPGRNVLDLYDES